MAYLLSCLLLATASAVASAQSSFFPARPPAIPLAVRSPYLSTWQAAGSNSSLSNGGYLAGQWPSFWNGATTSWTGFIRVDNITYTWMGDPSPLPTTVNQTAFNYTSTRSVFTMDVAGLVTMNITFLSPVTPDDMLRQGVPFSYLLVDVASADGAQHDVQLYSDVSAEWTSGNRSQIAQWDYGVTPANSTDTNSSESADGIAYHKFWRQTQLQFTEDNQQAAWGNWYYATENVTGLSYQSGADVDVRGQFTTNGFLNDTTDTAYRAIDQDWPTFGFAVDLGSVGSQAVDTLFSINLAQNLSIQYESSQGNQTIPSLWTSNFDDDLEALAFFYNDWTISASLATDLDNKVAADSIAAAGQDYLTMTSLAVRQAWGAIKLCGNSTTQYIFLKEISSDGDIQTVDVIFPFHPMLLYMNPAWLKLMLDPLFINQESGMWPEAYAIHDLGIYPNATGHSDGLDEMQPLEECGDMLIMTLAYAQKTGDVAYLNTHYELLDQWTQYLVAESLIPADQISSDDFAGALANQTNLALKGMIGIQAMATIANLTGHTEDGQNYTSIARSYIAQWQTLGIAQYASPPHATLSYGQNDTHGLLYNLYADVLLHTHLVPTSVYEMQSAFYQTVNDTYGVPLDTRHEYTKNDWESFCAAIASESTRDMFISEIARWIAETPSNTPVTDLYEVDNGEAFDSFIARPVVGGWFALLALNQTGIPANNTG